MATITRTARQVTQRALRLLAVIGQGQTLDAEQENDALYALNGMLASWTAEGLMVPTTESEQFTLVAGTISYTIGSGGDFDTTRPHQIVGGYLTDGNDYQLESMTLREWNRIWSKASSTRPSRFYYRADYPLGVVYFDWTPDSNYTIRLEMVQPLGEFDDLTDTITLPPEYMRAMEYNLAIEIAPEYEVVPSPAVVKVADESKATVMRLNFANNINAAEFDPELVRRYEYGIDHAW